MPPTDPKKDFLPIVTTTFGQVIDRALKQVHTCDCPKCDCEKVVPYSGAICSNCRHGKHTVEK